MRVPFARGGRVELGPLDPEEARIAETFVARLSASADRAHGVDRVISFAARDAATGALLGRIALDPIDWRARQARVVARWVEGAPRATDALALVAAYAFDELNLDEVVGAPLDAFWEAALAGAGFARQRGVWRRPRPLV